MQTRETQAFLIPTERGADETHRLHQYRIKLQGKHDLRCTPRFKFNDHVRL